MFASYHGSKRVIILLGILALTACSPGQPRSEPGTARAGNSQPATRSDTPAIIAGRPVSWAALTPLLAEAAGGTVLAEYALGQALDREAERLGIVITSADLEAESSDLVRSIRTASAVGESDSARLLEQIRAGRGLGEHRYAALLRRNAILRQLVEDRAVVSPAEIELAVQIRTGPRKRVRVIVTPTEREAARARAAVLAASDTDRVVAFASAAMESSTDSSAAAGGLLGDISLADPAYPKAVRDALAALKPGQMTPVIALPNGFAVMLVERLIEPGPAPSDAERLAMADQLRTRKQRLEMDRLAAELLDRAAITVLDPALGWSHRSRAGN